MKTIYNIELSHEDFITLLSILKNARDKGVIQWDCAGLVCEHTKVIIKS